MNQFVQRAGKDYEDILNGPGTGLEKLRKLFIVSIKSPGNQMMINAAPHIMKNPRFLTKQLFESLDNSAPT